MSRDPDPESLAALVAAIYEAAFEPDRWPSVLPGIVRSLHAEQGFIGLTSSQRGHSVSAFAHEIDEDGLHIWQEEFGGYDPWYARAGTLATGAVLRGSDVVPWDELRAMEVHRALFHPARIDDILCTCVANHGRTFDFVTVHRSLRRGFFDDEDVRILRFLAPHLARAAQVHDRLSFFAERCRGLEAVLDALPYGVTLVDREGRLLLANREAERILGAGDGLALRAGVVCAEEPAARRRLAGALAETCRAAETGSPCGGALLAVPRAASLRHYQLLLIPVPVGSADRVFGFAGRRVTAALVLSDPEAAREPAAATLRRLFDLTPALARLAAALASGQTLAEYAETAQITKGTVRGYLKDLFSRTGTRRQAELVRLLTSGVLPLRRPEDDEED